jgi:endonuclease-3
VTPALFEKHPDARSLAGEEQETLELLIKPTGFFRNKAKSVLGNAFGIDEGVVVDTHVRRLSQRLGLTKEEDPEKIEQDLMELVPREEWTDFSHLLIFHGRRVCHARKPKHDQCAICELCPTCTL